MLDDESPAEMTRSGLVRAKLNNGDGHHGSLRSPAFRLRVVARAAAVALALALGVAYADEPMTTDAKIQDIVAKMEHGGIASVWDRTVDLENLGPEAVPAVAEEIQGA